MVEKKTVVASIQPLNTVTLYEVIDISFSLRVIINRISIGKLCHTWLMMRAFIYKIISHCSRFAQTWMPIPVCIVDCITVIRPASPFVFSYSFCSCYVVGLCLFCYWFRFSWHNKFKSIWLMLFLDESIVWRLIVEHSICFCLFIFSEISKIE